MTKGELVDLLAGFDDDALIAVLVDAGDVADVIDVGFNAALQHPVLYTALRDDHGVDD